MTERTAQQIANMKQQTIGVEVEMKENSPVLIARYGKRKLINREAFEEYLDKHPELRRRE